MNRTELNSTMSARLGIPLEVVAAIMDTCWVTITEQLVAGEKVTIPSFGTFEVGGRSGWKGGPSRAKQTRLANFRAWKGLNEALMRQ